MTAFKFRETFRAPAGLKAEVAAQEMDRVRRETGALTPKALVEASRDKSAPLHGAFEWCDRKAGAMYREQQAATLIRAVVRIETERAPEHREFVLVKADQPDERASYVPAAEVVQRVDLYADALSRLAREVTAARRAVAELEALAKQSGAEPDRLARIALAVKAAEAFGAIVAALN